MTKVVSIAAAAVAAVAAVVAVVAVVVASLVASGVSMASSPSQIQINSVSGEGQFNVQAGDSLSFIKKQLLSSAFHQVIDKELKIMGLDATLFWRKFESKFEESFAPHHKKLQNKYKTKKKKGFQRALRIKRLVSKSKFARLSRAIRSYSIKEMGRSYLRLQAKVDRKILSEIYLKLTGTRGATRHFDAFYLSANFRLEETSWTDLGAEGASDFVKVVTKHWATWFEDHLKNYFDEVIIANYEENKKLRHYLGMPSDASDKSDKGELGNSLWLSITIKIKKKDEDAFFKQRSFAFDGGFVLIDLKTNSSIVSYDFVEEIHKYDFRDSSFKLSSNLATQVSKMPLSHFAKIKGHLANLSQSIDQATLKVDNVRTVQDLIRLNNVLLKKGVAFRLSPTIASYGKKSGLIEFSFSGTEENLKKMLLSLENQKIGRHTAIVFPSRDNPFSLLLRRRDDEI